MIKKEKNSNGFTLVETMVVVVVFSAVMSLALAIFLGSIKNQRFALAQQKLAVEISYALNRVEEKIRDESIPIDTAYIISEFNKFIDSNSVTVESINVYPPNAAGDAVTVVVKTKSKVDEERDVRFRLQTTVLR